jgi:hypothetical protein
VSAATTTATTGAQIRVRDFSSSQDSSNQPN